MGNLYVNEKQGVFIHQCNTKLPELKTKGVILRHLETGDIITVSNKLFESKFKMVKKFTIEEL